MFTLRTLILSERMRSFMMIVILVVFIGFGVNIIAAEKNLVTQIMYVIFLSFFTFFFVISESLRFIHRKATYYLAMKVDFDKSILWLKRLEKFDIIKGYQQAILVFYTLYYRDTGQFALLKTHLEHPLFQRSASLRLIYKINSYYLAIEEKDDALVTSLYKEIRDIYLIKQKKKNTPRFVFDINQLSADFYLFKNNPSKTHDALKAILLDKLNPREQSYYFITYAHYIKLKGQANDQVYVNKAKDISPLLYHVKNYS